MEKKLKLLYKSSYDRGLHHLLKMWPEIRKRIPNATLDVAYGWNLFLRGYSNNPYMMKWYEEMQELLKQEGITEHGRLSKEDLDTLSSSCDIWAYYCTFDESNCISALDSQKLGIVPITMKRAGLIDTVYSGTLIDMDGDEIETREEYIKALEFAANNPDWLKTESEKGKQGITPFYWENIAKLWIDQINEQH